MSNQWETPTHKLSFLSVEDLIRGNIYVHFERKKNIFPFWGEKNIFLFWPILFWEVVLVRQKDTPSLWPTNKQTQRGESRLMMHYNATCAIVSLGSCYDICGSPNYFSGLICGSLNFPGDNIPKNSVLSRYVGLAANQKTWETMQKCFTSSMRWLRN